MLNFENLQSVNKLRCERCYHPIDRWSPTDWGCALGGECGEALNLIKKLRRLDTANITTVNNIQTTSKEDIIRAIGDELADIVIYADLCATRLGLSLDTCITNKFNKDSDKIGTHIKL